MTINIPLKAVAFVLYTLALLGGAFGISYVVFEWRDSDGSGNTSAIEQRIDELEGKVSAESDAQKCAGALAVVNDTPSRVIRDGLGRPALASNPSDFMPNPVYETIIDLIDRYCD